MGTIQLDSQMPARFGLTYVGEDNAEHTPYVIHRALFGSLERFMGILIEHYGGAFPTWLAPEQVRIVPVSDAFVEYGETVAEHLRTKGFRAEVDRRREGVGYKIRDAELHKVPYMVVVGEKEVGAARVSVRSHAEGELGQMDLDHFVTRLRNEAEPPAPRRETASARP
jgi:threonyl-tRNA synthetase